MRGTRPGASASPTPGSSGRPCSPGGATSGEEPLPRLRRPPALRDRVRHDSQGHLLTNEQLLAHLRAVARAVRKGGLYVFDRYMASSWTNPARSWSWFKRRGRLVVRVSFSALNEVNPVSQIFRERMTLEAIDNGTRRLYRQSHLSRMVFPQELRALVELAGGFEFVQWFFGFKPHQLLERSRRPLIMVVVLRRT